MHKSSLYKIVQFSLLVLLLVFGLGTQAKPVAAVDPVSIVVNSTGDEAKEGTANPLVCETSSGNNICTLRAAIQTANSLDAASGTLITFRIPGIPNFAPTIIDVPEDWLSLPALNADYTTIQGPNLQGPSPVIIRGGSGQPSQAFNIQADGCAIKNLTIAGFEFGIYVGSPTNSALGAVITGNKIGDLIPNSALPHPNNVGIKVNNSNGAVIGGETSAERNIIAGNSNIGINIQSSGTNYIKGNYIGVKSDGATPLPNGYGILIDGSIGNYIGGDSDGERNIISGNTNGGIFIKGNYTTVTGNYIGTNAAGTIAVPNGNWGIQIGETGPSPTLYWNNNVIGGSNPGEGNLVSGNSGAGISVAHSELVNIKGNTIGLNAAQSAPIPNLVGIKVFASSNTIVGGSTTGSGNIISGNTQQGVSVGGEGTTSITSIEGNFIGINGSGSAFPNGMSGIEVLDANTTVIGGTSAGAGNTIAHNVKNGIDLGSTPVRVAGNSIHSNGALGIDVVKMKSQVGVTLNDIGDVDTIQNFPVISNVSFPSPGMVRLQGEVLTGASVPLDIYFYANASCDPTRHGEGQVYLGITSKTSTDAGRVSFSITLPDAGSHIYFTAVAYSQNNGSSEFSACKAMNTYLPMIIR